MTKPRKPHPRTPGLSATFIEAEEAIITEAVAKWRVEREERLTSEASNRWFEGFFLRQLHLGDTGYGAACIVEMARNGHPPADRAVRRFIEQAMESDRFQELPVSVRDYARESIWRPSLTPVYGSRAPQIVNHVWRDTALCLAISKVPQSWPGVPLLYSTHRRSAAALVGGVFGLSEKQARRVYQANGELARRFYEFLTAYRAEEADVFVAISRTNGCDPNGR